jgi:hypothetical protein
MRVIKITLGLTLALCLLAAAAASASATSLVWEKKVSGVFAEITTAITVEAEEATFKITDEGTKITFTCKGAEKSAIGPKGEGEVTEVKVTSKPCESSSSTCEKPEVKAVNLPWTTALVEEKGEKRNDITSIKAGSEIECTAGSSKGIKDKCTGATSVKVTNNIATGNVETEFDKESAGGVCKGAPGAGKSKVVGKAVIKHPGGTEAIRAS